MTEMIRDGVTTPEPIKEGNEGEEVSEEVVASHKCWYCNKEYPEDEMEKAGSDWVCSGCYEDGLVTMCEGCGDVICSDDAHWGNDYQWCQDCWSDRFFYCEYCSETFPIREAREAPNGSNYCCDCALDQFFTCEDCGGIFWNNDDAEARRVAKVLQLTINKARGHI